MNNNLNNKFQLRIVNLYNQYAGNSNINTEQYIDLLTLTSSELSTFDINNISRHFKYILENIQNNNKIILEKNDITNNTITIINDFIFEDKVSFYEIINTNNDFNFTIYMNTMNFTNNKIITNPSDEKNIILNINDLKINDGVIIGFNNLDITIDNLNNNGGIFFINCKVKIINSNNLNNIIDFNSEFDIGQNTIGQNTIFGNSYNYYTIQTLIKKQQIGGMIGMFSKGFNNVMRQTNILFNLLKETLPRFNYIARLSDVVSGDRVDGSELTNFSHIFFNTRMSLANILSFLKLTTINFIGNSNKNESSTKNESLEEKQREALRKVLLQEQEKIHCIDMTGDTNKILFSLKGLMNDKKFMDSIKDGKFIIRINSPMPIMETPDNIIFLPKTQLSSDRTC